MKILCYDHGLCTEAAITLARAGHDVGYYVPNDDAFPKPAKALIGCGLEGLERVSDSKWDDAFARADMVFCPDTRSKKIIDQCRREHKPHWGGGNAERLELDRLWMKEQQRKMGLPVGPYLAVTGIEKLVAHLKTVKDKWVKVSSGEYRGVIETFHHEEWDSTEAQFLGQLLVDFGADADNIVFLVEDPLEGAEVGGDYFWCQGKRIGTGYGYEYKDTCYLGRDNGILPEALAQVDDKLRPLGGSCCSWVSTEVICGKRNYLIDPTIRCPHPPMAGMLEMYPGLPLLITSGAFGKTADIAFAPQRPYSAVLVIRSEWADDHWTEVHFPPEFRRNIKLVSAYAKDGHYFALPGNSFVAYVVDLGSTPSAAIEQCTKIADKVRCRESIMDPSKFDVLLEKTIPEGRKAGIPF